MHLNGTCRRSLQLLSLYTIAARASSSSTGIGWTSNEQSHRQTSIPRYNAHDKRQGPPVYEQQRPVEQHGDPSRLPPPPPPPPPRPLTPIHYEFQQRSETEASNVKAATDHDDELPVTMRPDMDEQATMAHLHDSRNGPLYVSPRQDAFTRQMSTRTGRLTLAAACLLVGAGLGQALSHSLLQKSNVVLVTTLSCLFLLASWLRNSYGELVRALGLALLLTLRRTKRVRRLHPTMPHLKASLQMQPRVGFPVRIIHDDMRLNHNDVAMDDYDAAMNYNSLYTLIAMCFVGAVCGGSLPLLPTWMGALLGAGLLGVSTTLDSARGDLSRCMGARVVALSREMIQVNDKLHLTSKLGVVAGKVLDKLLILDRQHGVRRRIVAAFNLVYRQVSNAIENRSASSNNDIGEDDDSRRRSNERRPAAAGSDDHRRRNEGRNDMRLDDDDLDMPRGERW
ncbi:hypothetical protein MPSEU_000761800 [Mayamaea pseudoterrestris]|nr:hypothetical protein MPSEU_000761800 [Mayamaea pseudoterrestris]